MTTVIHKASRCAALVTPALGTADPIQLHAAAHNALSMALWHLRQPTSNIPGATRRTVQALAALNRLHGRA